ncbi:MAG: hypothetical protein ACREOI_01025 [bacterium]
MLLLSCPTCQKYGSYAVEELVGRCFICKYCHTVNLLPLAINPAFKPNETGRFQSDESDIDQLQTIAGYFP